MTPYVDVHTHLVHRAFADDADAAAERAADAGVAHVIVNGLEPRSNRATLELADRHPNVHAALGIYPVDAIASVIDRDAWEHPFDPPAPFDVDDEIAFIDSVADRIVAVGECGLDAHWVTDHADEQERVLRALCEVAVRHDLPVILHTRRAEERTWEIVREMGVRRADFHCFGGRSNLAVRIAEDGYCFSIPPVVERAEAFQALARKLPPEALLTETDAPYMSPDRGERNEPSLVPRGVAAIARARGEDEEQVRETIWENFRRLFPRAVPS